MFSCCWCCYKGVHSITCFKVIVMVFYWTTLYLCASHFLTSHETPLWYNAVQCNIINYDLSRWISAWPWHRSGRLLPPLNSISTPAALWNQSRDSKAYWPVRSWGETYTFIHWLTTAQIVNINSEETRSQRSHWPGKTNKQQRKTCNKSRYFVGLEYESGDIFQYCFLTPHCRVSLPFLSGCDSFEQMLAFEWVQHDGSAVKWGKERRSSWRSRLSMRSVGRKVWAVFLIFPQVDIHLYTHLQRSMRNVLYFFGLAAALHCRLNTAIHWHCLVHTLLTLSILL